MACLRAGKPPSPLPPIGCLSCLQAIKAKWGVGADELRVLLHYQPSYYHLHVHFAHLACPAAGVAAGKALLLDDVIGEPQPCSAAYSNGDQDRCFWFQGITVCISCEGN